MDALGMTQAMLSRLTGAHRITVYRWQSGELPVPKYAITILDQVERIRALTYRLTESSGKPRK